MKHIITLGVLIFCGTCHGSVKEKSGDDSNDMGYLSDDERSVVPTPSPAQLLADKYLAKYPSLKPKYAQAIAEAICMGDTSPTASSSSSTSELISIPENSDTCKTPQWLVDYGLSVSGAADYVVSPRTFRRQHSDPALPSPKASSRKAWHDPLRNSPQRLATAGASGLALSRSAPSGIKDQGNQQ